MQFDTIFDLASVSKVVGTSLAAFINIDDGRFTLDDPVAKFIPGFEANGKGDVTIKDLMTHVSGLKPYENYKVVMETQKTGEPNSDALIRHYASLELNYPPRSKSRYSCLNFQTMARGHFTVRRLERIYTPEAVQSAYEKLGAESES